jgi:hypothetical protein
MLYTRQAAMLVPSRAVGQVYAQVGVVVVVVNANHSITTS